MKLLSTSLELKALKSICKGDEKTAGLILAGVSKDSFQYKPAKEAFSRLLSLINAQGSIPDWTELCADPVISETSRNILKSFTEKGVYKFNRRKIRALVNALERYRQLRGLLNLSEETLKSLEDEKVDLDALLDRVSEKLVHVRTRKDARETIVHYGRGNNATRIVKDLLYGKSKAYVPTGFRAHDEKNGGFLDGSLVVIAANTGGGKTALGNQLLINMTKEGEDCCIVPLEMTEEQMSARILGNLSGIDVVKIARKKLTRSEKKVIKRAYVEWVNKLKKERTRYSIFVPEVDMTIEEILLVLQPYSYKVIIIDYISLLKDADGDDQWKKLGKIARFAKVYAKNTGSIVILLAQLSEEGKVKYSRTIVEHANNAWVWTMPDEHAETSILEITQLKARNQSRFKFQLLSHNATMRITDVEDAPNPEEDQESEEKESKTKAQEYLNDLTEEEEQDNEEASENETEVD